MLAPLHQLSPRISEVLFGRFWSVACAVTEKGWTVKRAILDMSMDGVILFNYKTQPIPIVAGTFTYSTWPVS